MSDAFQSPLAAPVVTYRCGLADAQRRTGSLCGKQHCAGCMPYRPGPGPGPVGAPIPIAVQAAPPPTASTPAAPGAYVSRSEHEILIARAVRESYEARRGDRRDLFIAAVIGGLADARDPADARDLARRTLEIVDALLAADEKEK